MLSEQSEQEMAREAFAVAYVTACCATTLLYDYCLTFSDEAKRIWGRKFSIPNALFFVDRYIVLPMIVFNGIAATRNKVSDAFCVFYLRWLSICITTTYTTVDGILLTRVVAIYRQNIPVKVFACCLYAGGVIVLVGLTVTDYVGEGVHIVDNFSALPGCYPASVPSIIAGYWIAPVIIESAFFVLVMWRVFTWSSKTVSPTLALMARDSAVYFALIFALLIINLFVFEYAPPFISSLFVTPVNTIGCMAGYRMLMNIRGMYEIESTSTFRDMYSTRGAVVHFAQSQTIGGTFERPPSGTGGPVMNSRHIRRDSISMDDWNDSGDLPESLSGEV